MESKAKWLLPLLITVILLSVIWTTIQLWPRGIAPYVPESDAEKFVVNAKERLFSEDPERWGEVSIALRPGEDGHVDEVQIIGIVQSRADAEELRRILLAIEPQVPVDWSLLTIEPVP